MSTTPTVRALRELRRPLRLALTTDEAYDHPERSNPLFETLMRVDTYIAGAIEGLQAYEKIWREMERPQARGNAT